MLDLLPLSWRPFAKYIYPSLAAVVATLILWVTEGHMDRAQMEVGLLGLICALVTFLARNASDGLRAYLKALAPALLAVAVVLVHTLVTGEFDNDSWRLAIAGLGAAFVALIVPNAAPTP